MAIPTPLDLVFARSRESVFPVIRTALETGGHEPGDRDGFLMVPEVIQLLHQLRPAEGLGEGMDQLVAFLHHAYLTWESGELTLSLPGERLTALLETPSAATPDAEEPPRAYYVQLVERRIWARVVEGEAAEPMDGCFVHRTPAGKLRVLGIFGFRPEREGFSAVETAGERPHLLTRPDGTPLFAPVLPGGDAAGLFSLVGAEELLELGWRTRPLAAELAGVPR